MPERTAVFRAMEDRELVIAFKAGAPGAYDEMYRRYSARVGNVCRRMLSNREDAQEAVQETFLKAYLALPEFNGNYRLGAWLGRIASNVCVDQLRVRSRSATVVPLHADTAAVAVESSPEDVVVGDAPEVTEQMGAMQPLHAQALVLRGVEGLSHREIAGKLSMTPSQVKALLHRARRSFKRSWDDAKGWALAPLALLRATSRQLRNASQAGAQVAGATVGPVLAERVAASAVIVAVALTGLPQASLGPREDEARRAHRGAHATEWQMTGPRTSTAPAPKDRLAPPSRPARSADAITAGQELVPGLQKVLARAHATVGHAPKQRSEDKDDENLVPIAPRAAGKTVERLVDTTEDLLPD